MHILKRNNRETGRDYALRVLKHNIVNMDIVPGSMVSENELAAALGLSRTPIREALIELAKVRIVEIYPQKGSAIALIDLELVEQSYFMRETLECEIIGQVCDMATEADLAKLRVNLAEQEYFIESGSRSDDIRFIDLDNQFHSCLFSAAKKDLVFQVIQDIVIHFDRIRNLTIDYVKPEDVLKQHQGIFKAIEERDRYLAIALTKEHLGRFRGIENELRDKYPGYFKP